MKEKPRLMPRPQFLGVLVAIGLLAALVAGCGGGSTSASGTSTGGSGGGESTSGYLPQMEKSVEKYFGPKGTFEEEPTTSPVRAGENRKIAVISCGQQSPACANGSDAAIEAAHKLGWQATLFDAKLNLPSAATGIRQAIAAGDEGIYVYYIDCSYIKTALEEAKKAGIPVVGSDSRDCNEIEPGSPSLYTYSIHYAGGANYDEYQEHFFVNSAEAAIVHFNGESKALIFLEEIPAAELYVEAIEKVYNRCSGCSYEFVRFPYSAIGTGLQGIAEQELLKHPETNTVIPSYEIIAQEIYPAVRASGKSSEIFTFMGEGGQGGLDLLRNGALGVSFNWPVEWEGYGAVDALGRLMLGQKPVATGQGSQLVDDEHNMPESGPAVSPVDFKAMYEKAWGIK
jgi:ribose transport system substrate-binding protein